MSDHSDYKKSRTNLFNLLPEVYQSGVNESILETTFNRFLTKSELKRVIGYIGQGNPNAIVNRQIQEPTPHRQAFQLQPILYSKIGTIEHMASWKDIQAELERLGIDLDRMQEWGKALAFNWAPPIDYDKIINFRDYYWYNPDDIADQPQYVQIQNLCIRAEAKVDEYQNTLTEFGSTHPIVGLDSANGTFTIDDDLVAIFKEGFIFYVKDSTNSTINNEFWTTASSTLNQLGQTVITVQITSSPSPINDSIVNGNISLEELSSVFDAERDCLCNGNVGWGGGLWDDNQLGDILWNIQLLSDITHPTEASWILANGAPAANDLWYDTNTDDLKQYQGGSWIIVQTNFSALIAATTGGNLWDLTTACGIESNPWIAENKWLHKNQVPNFALAKQAQIPIIEFLPTVDLNEWVETTYQWQYRTNPITDTFADTTASPNLFEINGVDDYSFPIAFGSEILLNSKYGNLTEIFVPGYKFEIEGSSNILMNVTYTVDYSIYCEEVSGTKYQTKIGIVGTLAGTETDGIMLPILTSQGDPYFGVHRHWLFVGLLQSQPVSKQPINPMLEIPDNPPPASVPAVFSSSPSVQFGEYTLSLYAQEVTVNIDSAGELDIVGVGVAGSPGDSGYFDLSGDSVDFYNSTEVKNLVVSGNTGGGVNGIYTIVPSSATLVLGNTRVLVKEPVPTTATSTGTAYPKWEFLLDSTLQNISRFEANEVRVYIDNVRQYGTYQEINVGVLTSGSPFYGSPLAHSTCDDFVNSIFIEAPISKFGVLRVEVGAASVVDLGLENVPVRTDSNDMTFNPSLPIPCVNLVRYRKLEQLKVDRNQYPLFDLFTVEGDTTNIASRVFAFQESQDEPIDPFFGKRIVHSTDRREYYYEQFLVEEDNGRMFTYRDNSISGAFWFETDNQVLFRWNGETWDNRIITTDYASGSPLPGLCYVKPIVSDTAPGAPWDSIDGMLWFNTFNNTINVSDGVSWSENSLLTAATTVSAADPTLISIWRTGPDDVVCEQRETYIPDYVDKDRNSVSIGDVNGDWEIPDQLYFNALHENRKVLSSSELLAHFLSVIENQEVPPGFIGTAQQLYHVLTDVNYGKGGKIKEYNGSYDSFLSSIFIQNVNPLTLYEFAHDAYENALNQIKEFFRKDIESIMTDPAEDAIADIVADITEDLIDQYEQNDYASFVYGDSNTYIQETDTGIKNWPATLPFIRMAFKVVPQSFVDEETGLNEMRHHDGHLSTVRFTSTAINAFNLRIIRTEDTRVTNPSGTWGVQSNMIPPAAFTDYENQFGETAGCYWYHVTQTSRVLYRMTAVRISIALSEPSTTLPIGSYWYDVTNDRLKVLTDVGSPSTRLWTNATVASGLLTEGNVSAWEVINLDEILTDVILELETRLYNAVPDLTELAYDLDTTFANNSALADDLFEEAFFAFVSQVKLLDPLENDSYDMGDAFTWNYKASTQSGSPTLTPKIGSAYVSGGIWEDVYQKNYGTPYPHLEPWKMQGYISKPSWWDSTYKCDTLGCGSPLVSRRWTTLMWSNILSGVVPIGEALPNGLASTGVVGEVQKYNYVSVNIDSVSHGGYNPDSLFPPFWEPPTLFSPIDFGVSQVRSIFDNDTLEIINPDADYQYGDAGTVEWRWRNSTQYLYDSLKVAFKIDPVEFIQKTLGERFLEIGCLEVSQRTEKVYAHQNALFHGDLLSDSTILKFAGTLQWYTNFNRFNGYDSSSSNFRSMWSGWTTPLGYQFSTFINTESFLVSNTNFDVSEQDYNVRIKRSPGIDDHWVDALNITLLKSPPALIRKDTESQWEFLLSSFSPIGRQLTYYGNFSFGFSVNLTGSPTGSPNDVVTNVMTISDPYGRTLPWVDGDAVIVSSDQFLPSPLLADTLYYVNVSSATEFSLSESRGGPVIELLSTGVGNHTVSQITRSFDALNGQSTDKIWYKYAVDKSLVLTQLLPTRVIGIQKLINIVFGYEAYEIDVENYRFNHEATDIDPGTNRVINWQLEIERFIDFAYNARTRIQGRRDSFKFTADDSPLVLKFEKTTEINNQGKVIERIIKPAWLNGQAVTVFPDIGSSLPEPLLANVQYYFFAITDQDFGLAVTRRNAINDIGVDLLSTGTGDFYVQEFFNVQTRPEFEMNPFRNNIWLSTPIGVVADTVRGPFFDVRTDQILFDQYGRRLSIDKTLALRQDTLTRIQVTDAIPNDVDRDFTPVPDPYNYLHLTSAHLFIDGYEHVLLFNNYASNGALIYDPFIGLNTPRFDVQFDRSLEFNLRPNVGGYVLLNQQNVDSSTTLVRNMEGQTEDLRFMYDTYRSLEANNLVEEVRDSLGYDGPFDFLNAININPKSQFIFWRGMIQSKGSVNSIKAFINSRRFVDARIDEFWAYKIAEFGDNNELQIPEINLFADDTRIGEIRFHFIDTDETADTGFIGVTNVDQERWYEYPNQQEFFNANGNMYFNVKLEVFQPRSSNEYKRTVPWVGISLTEDYVYEFPYPVDAVKVFNSVTGFEITGVELLNSTTLIFKSGINPYNPPTVIADIYVFSPYESKHNPAKIRDVVEELTISDVILWDPSRNNHYHNAIHLVDVQRDTDPITNTITDGSPEEFVNRYEFQISSITGEPEEVFADTYDPWGRKEVGTIWLDTNELEYVPYSDTILNADVFDRLKQWGQLAEWASYKIYQWTESDILPTAYDAIASLEEGDLSIDAQIRKSGTVKKEIWKNVETTTVSGTLPSKYIIADPSDWNPLSVSFSPTITSPAKVYQNGTEVFDVTSVLLEIIGGSIATETFVVSGDKSSNMQTGDTIKIYNSSEPLLDNNEFTVTSVSTSVGSPTETSIVVDLNSEFGSPIGSFLGSPAFVGNISVIHNNVHSLDYIMTQTSTFDVGDVITVVEEDTTTSTITSSWEKYGFEKYQVGSTYYYEPDDILFDVTPDEPAVIYKNEFELVETLSYDGGFVNSGETNFLRKIIQVKSYVSAGAGSSLFELEGDQTAVYSPGDRFLVYIDTFVPSIEPGGVSFTVDSVLLLDIGSSTTTIVKVLEAVSLSLSPTILKAGPNTIDFLLSYWLGFSLVDKNDKYTVVKFQPSEDQIDGTTYKEVIPYSTEVVIENDEAITKYFFWVENKSVPETNRGKELSVLEAVQQLENIPVPYVVPQNLQSAVGSPITAALPQRYTQAILRNYGTLINADNRYVLRFTRNFVLRDDLRDTEDGSLLKTIHQEWEIFRKEQQFNIPQTLWNLMIESIIGQTRSSIGSVAVRVPALDRELFDIENNTTTRIGIAQSGQAFCDGERAWEAILQYLQDGDNDFSPIDIQTFFITHDILNLTPRTATDAEAIDTALTEIYNSFTFENVNRMFFSVLNTAALPFQKKYEDLFKTSWVALHGIKILEVEGIFDD